MQLDTQKLEKSLLKKGFRQANNDHRYYRFYHNGKKTRIFTFISHGSGYKTYPESLYISVKMNLNPSTTAPLTKRI